METFTEFTFDAAHASPPYEPMHGHTFTVRVVMRGEPDPEYGWSHDLYAVKKHVSEVRALVDHKILNDIDGIGHPSIENVTRFLYEQFRPRIQGLVSVTLSRGLPGSTEGCTVSTSTSLATPARATAHA